VVDTTVFVCDKCVELVVVAVAIVVIIVVVVVVAVAAVVVTVVALTMLLSCALDSEVRTFESFSKHGLFVSLCSLDELDFLLCFELEE
jgi:hypothetical protein